MGKVILGVTISLDGFAEDIDGSVNTLYPDHDALVETEYFKESVLTTGSVVDFLEEIGANPWSKGLSAQGITEM